MKYKKTFWMNVFGALGWLALIAANYLLFANLDEHTTKHNIIQAILCSGVIATPAVTALYLCYSSSQLLKQLAVIGNGIGIVAITWYCLSMAYNLSSPSITGYLLVLFFSLTIILPCFINLKALSNYSKSQHLFRDLHN
jgi:hypothetical protein